MKTMKRNTQIKFYSKLSAIQEEEEGKKHSAHSNTRM
jgi:hypothetical protein